MLKVAILDTEEEYLRQLCGYMMEKKHSHILLETFLQGENFWEQGENFDVIIVCVSIWLASPAFQNDKRVILLGEETIPVEAEGIPVVLKYQPVSRIMAQIAELSWQEKNKKDKWIQAVKAEVIGVYSPVHHEAQMMFSMTLAQLLGKNKKVLYLNFMENSGFKTLYQIEENIGLSEILYEALVPDGNICSAVLKTAVSVDEADCIPPVQNPEHLVECTKENYLKLLEDISRYSGYEVVIVDFGVIFSGFFHVLKHCSSIYCIGGKGSINHCRMQEFDEFLGTTIGEEGFIRITLPEGLEFLMGEDIVQKGVYGVLGDYIRKVVLGGSAFEG